MFFTDPIRTPFPERSVARLPRGAGVVYRAFGAADALAVGLRLARLCRRRGLVLFVGASAPLALSLRADGLHLPQRLAHRAGDIRRAGKRFIVTAAAHDLPAALRAQRSGVRAVVISPVFPSASPSAGTPLRLHRFARLALQLDTQVYALGGINASTVRGLARTGACGAAAIGGVAI